MWWLALKTETSVSLSDESTSIASSTRQPLIHSVLSVAFPLYILKGTLLGLPCCLTSLESFSSFSWEGYCPLQWLVFGLNCFCIPLSCVRFDWIFFVSIKKHTDLLIPWAEPSGVPFLFVLFPTFFYFMQEIKRCWSIVNMDGTMKIQFCSL